MYEAEVGDAGRMDASGKGEDPTVNRLEDLAAQLTGKEAAMLVPSGTMGNLAALMTYCSAGRRVGVEKKRHVYQNEKSAFSERPGGLIPEFFETDHQSHPKRESIKAILDEKNIALPLDPYCAAVTILSLRPNAPGSSWAERCAKPGYWLQQVLLPFNRRGKDL